MSYQIPTKNEFLAFRQKADPLADKVVHSVIKNDSPQAIHNIFNSLRTNVQIDSVNFPPDIREYFTNTAELPSWAEQEKIKMGEQVFSKYGPSISLCLLCKSLPEAYVCKKGAKVLYTTGRMTEHDGSLEKFTRRLMETAQFVINVCSPGGLSPQGNGIVTTQKVRLIHAAIRYFIIQHGWDIEKYGQPINQQDMAGTLQSFSTLIIQGLEELQIELTDEEKEGYYHCWRVVGHIIGLEKNLMPNDYVDGFLLGKAILNDQMAASKEGKALTQAVINFMANLLPGNLFNHSPEIIIRYLTKDEVADKLGVASHDTLINKVLPRLLGKVFHSVEEAEDKSKFFSHLVQEINQHMLQGMLNHFNEHKQVHFYIPPNLKDNWNLK